MRLVSLTRPSDFARRMRNCAPLQGEDAMTSLHGADVLIRNPGPAATLTTSSFASASTKNLWTNEFASKTVRILGDRRALSKKPRPLPRSRVAKTRQIALRKERERAAKYTTRRKFLPPVSSRNEQQIELPPELQEKNKEEQILRFVPPVSSSSSEDKDDVKIVHQLDKFKPPRFEIRC